MKQIDIFSFFKYIENKLQIPQKLKFTNEF